MRLPLVPLAVAIAAMAARSRLRRSFVAVTVRGQSMWPSYPPGSRVLVCRNAAIATDCVVVVERPDDGGTRWQRPPVPRTAGDSAISERKWMIKRVAALTGDPVPHSVIPSLADKSEASVPAEKAVLLGDNQGSSFDSRSIGYFPTNRILGPIMRRPATRRRR